MSKKVTLINAQNNVLGEYKEWETEINKVKIEIIDVSSMMNTRRIFFYGENKKMLGELFIPQNILVKVEF